MGGAEGDMVCLWEMVVKSRADIARRWFLGYSAVENHAQNHQHPDHVLSRGRRFGVTLRDAERMY